MSKHTPGPWHVSQNAYGTVFINGGETLTTAVGTKYKEIVAGGNSHDTLTLENARLIAAAPELLEALKDCLDRFVEAFPEAKNYGPIKRGHDAIAKAEGRS